MQNTENLKKTMKTQDKTLSPTTKNKTIRKTSALDVGLDFGSDVRADVKMSDLLLGQIGSYIDLLLQAKEIGHCPMASNSLAVSDHFFYSNVIDVFNAFSFHLYICTLHSHFPHKFWVKCNLPCIHV